MKKRTCTDTRFYQLLLTALLALCMMVSSCTAVQRIEEPRRGAESYLELQVEPSNGEIYVDDQFMGVINGWREQTIPIQPGVRRLEIRASGYLPQRFDLEVEPGSHLVLRARLEREIGAFDEQHEEGVESSTSNQQERIIEAPTPRRGTERDLKL